MPPNTRSASVAKRLAKAAREDLEAHAHQHSRGHAITLILRDKEHSEVKHLAGLAGALERSERLVIEAGPGTGKSTTLLQLGYEILSADNAIAALVPLSVWSPRSEGLLQYLPHVGAYRGFSPQHFMLLAHYGKLVLLLDGWNEVAVGARLKCMSEVESLLRQYPLLGIAVTSRSRQSVPFKGRTITVDALSEEQQTAIARELRGSEGEQLLDRAWRTPGVRDLVTVPLYLAALLADRAGGAFPTTKDEILRDFIALHESLPVRALALRLKVGRFHRNYLRGLAIDGVRKGATGSTAVEARKIVAGVAERLLHEHQITQLPDPDEVLDALADHHLLIRSDDGGDGTVEFKHQQIQEWLASGEVARLMLAAFRGDANAQQILRVEIIDRPPWEEAILFACEHLSRRDDEGRKAVSSVVVQTLSIDPILAADIIYRSTEGVWQLAKDAVVAMVNRWHAPGRVDRAARFMVTSGRAEFAEPVWRLINNKDRNVCLSALRAARRFRPSVLGPGSDEHLAALDADKRSTVTSEVILNGGTEGIEFVVSYSAKEADEEVQTEIIEALLFRRATRHALELLNKAPQSVWEKLSERRYTASEMGDEGAARRLKELREGRREADADKAVEISALLREEFNTESLERIETAIASPELDFKVDRADAALREALRVVPKAVAAGLATRIVAGLTLPFRCYELLDCLAPSDQGPLVDLVLDRKTDPERVTAAARGVGVKTVSLLIAELLAQAAGLDRSSSQEARDEFNKLEGVIGSTRGDAFVAGLLTHANTEDLRRIEILAELFSGHGHDFEGGQVVAGAKDLAAFKQRLIEWSETVLADPASTRKQYGEVAKAVSRLRVPELVAPLRRLLIDDLRRWKLAKEQAREARARKQLGPADANHSYVFQYGAAFAAIGTDTVAEVMQEMLSDPDFGLEAARVLRLLWRAKSGQPQERPGVFGTTWPNYSYVSVARANRQQAKEASTPLAVPIFAEIGSLCRGHDEKEHARALDLAVVALDMPHTSQEHVLQALMNLPVPLTRKRRLMISRTLAGEIIEADTVFAGYQAFLEEAKLKPWLLDEKQYDLPEWLELLAFSDRPMRVVEAIDLLEPAYRRQPWMHRRLVAALGHATNTGVEVLLALAGKDEGFLDMREWSSALFNLGSEKAIIGLLDTVVEKGRPHGNDGVDQYQLSRDLAKAATEQPRLRHLLSERYDKATRHRAIRILEGALSEFPDEETVLTIVKRYISMKRRFDGDLCRVLDHVISTRIPSERWQGAVETQSVPIANLRRCLFGLIDEKDAGDLVRSCLTYVDEQRDENGRPDGEPRHPDIAAGKPWPVVDVTA